MSLDPQKVKQLKDGRRLAVVTFSELQPFYAFNSGGQSVYKCPFCQHFYQSKSGYEGYKLYIDEVKRKGYCFRCETIVVFEESYDLAVETANFTKELKEDHKPKKYDVDGWTQAASQVQTVLDYLKTRKIQYTPAVLDRYHMRYGEAQGVPLLIIPNDLHPDDQTTNFFQYKVLDLSLPYPKYVTMCATPLMWLQSSVERTGRIFLVEGVFDGVAVDGVPMLGKTLSDGQQKQMREFCLKHKSIKNVTVAPDGDLNDKQIERLLKLVKKVCNDIPVFLAKLPSGTDPEDIVAAGESQRVFHDELVEVR